MLTNTILNRFSQTLCNLKGDQILFLNPKYHQMASEIFYKQVALEGKIDKKSLEKFLCQKQEEYQLSKIQRKEFVFIGRSNVGKSTLMNAMLGKRVAETSNYPGKTRTLDFYNIGNGKIIIDSPGYGFAKGNKKDTQNWGELMRNYIKYSPFLKQSFILIDAEHGFKEVDKMTLNLMKQLEKPFTIVFTKCDKINNNEEIINSSKQLLSNYDLASQVIHFTSVKNMTGLQELQANISLCCS